MNFFDFLPQYILSTIKNTSATNTTFISKPIPPQVFFNANMLCIPEIEFYWLLFSYFNFSIYFFPFLIILKTSYSKTKFPLPSMLWSPARQCLIIFPFHLKLQKEKTSNSVISPKIYFLGHDDLVSFSEKNQTFLNRIELSNLKLKLPWPLY